ncbi:MAG: DMT family transporter [Sulfolobales archaeon]|nr:DMT family transporter [Sulfolobales archaeon]
MSRLLLLSVVAVVSISSASIIVKLVDAPALVLAFWRLVLSTLLLYVTSFWRSSFRCVRGVNAIYVGVSGFALGLHFAAWIESLRHISIAVSVTLVTTHPIFTALISYFFIGERLRRPQHVGILLCLLGVSIMSLSGYSMMSSLYGVTLALLGALTASIYFTLGKFLRRACGLIEYVVPTYLVAALTSLALGLSLGVDFINHPLTSWLLIVLLAVGPMLGGHTVLNYLLRYMSAASVATVAACEPVGATILGMLVLNEFPDLQVVSGMLITLLGVYVVVSYEMSD